MGATDHQKPADGTALSGLLGGRVRLALEFVRADGTVEQLDAGPDGMEAVIAVENLPPLRGATASGVRVSLRITVVNQGRVALTGSVRAHLVVADVIDPWWLVPGVFYGENRPEDCFRKFPRFAVGAHDPAGMVSDRWEMRADRAATPAVFVWGHDVGAALVAEEMSPVGMVGLGFAHDEPSSTASVHLTFPYREGPVTYDGSDTPREADVATWTWAPHAATTFRAEAHLLPPDRHAYAPVLRAVHERSRSGAPLRPWVGVREAAEIAAHGLYHWHYDPDPGVLLETVGFDRGIRGQDGKPVDSQAMHVAWISGIPWAHALLAHARRVLGTPEETEKTAAQAAAAESVIDFVCSELSPSGTFWGVWYRATGWTQSWSPTRRALHARTLGEATLFLLRTIALGDDVPRAHPRWVAAARSNLDVVVGRQRADGNLGAAHHAETGEVLSWTGAGPLTWVATLAEAEALDSDGRYLAAAERAGEYYAQFVEREFVHGAPEDVDLAPTSEDGYAGVMAYVALYRRTGNPRWLDLARRVADWMLTFRYTYDVSFGPRTTLGVYDFGTRGGDQASSSNQHLHAYGLICTRELVELSRALKDEHYTERALEHLACFRQMVVRADGEVNGYRGMISERYYQTACFQPKGMLLTLSHAWSVGVLLLGCEQAVALDLANVEPR